MQVAISFEKSVLFTGWSLKTPKGGPNSSNFALYASNYKAGSSGDAWNASRAILDIPDSEWTLVGTPSWTPKRYWSFFSSSDSINKTKAHRLHLDDRWRDPRP